MFVVLLICALQHKATRCTILHHTAAYCITLQRSATQCSTLQHTATHRSVLVMQYPAATLTRSQHSTGRTTTILALDTGWRRPIGCLKLQVIFRKRATEYRALLRKMTYKDKASYDSSPPCRALCHILLADERVKTACVVAQDEP